LTFFFQAEDGIRDRNVTGVQACALPIFDNWDVAGMRATGSHNVHADRVFVPEELTFVRGGQPSIDEPITRYPGLAYAAQVLSAEIGRASCRERVEIWWGGV